MPVDPLNQAAQTAEDQNAAEAAPEQGGDIDKLIQGVGMGLQKLSEVLPPELAPKMAELMSEFQNILSGQPEEEGEEMEGQPAGGQMDAMAGPGSRPMM